MRFLIQMASTARRTSAHLRNGILMGLGGFGVCGLSACGLNYALVEFNEPLHGCPLRGRGSLESVDLKFQVFPFDQCSFIVFRPQSWAVGALTTHIEDVLGRGAKDVLRLARKFPERRFGDSKVQKQVRARWDGIGPGRRFFGSIEPGETRGCAKYEPGRPVTVGVATTPFFDRGGSDAPM